MSGCSHAASLPPSRAPRQASIRRRLQIYGRLDVQRDARDFQKEAREEIEDCLVYFAAHWLRAS
jgi:hypothetical protein